MIQVLHRAFDILELCAKQSEKVFSLSEISKKLDLNPPTCANILKTMVSRNYLEQVGYKKGYRLGSKAYHITGNFSFRRDLVLIAKAPMENLVDELNETCILSALRKSDLTRILLHEVQSNNDLLVRTAVEKEAYSAATGRLLIANLPQHEIEMLIEKFGLPRKSSWPEATSKEKLLYLIANIKKDGIVYQHDPNHIVGLAVPVFKEGKVIASLGIYMPGVRYQGEMKNVALSSIRHAAEVISSNIDDFHSNL